MADRHPMTNGQPMKLGVFGQNTGAAITTAEGTEWGNWSAQLRVGRLADDFGWDFLLPVARWRSLGGPSDFAGKSFEVNTWAAAMAAATRQIAVFTTTHVPIYHPLLAAKQIATIDHVSDGRLGVNVVVGWNAAELSMFGIEQVEHDQRYQVADEWITIIKKLWQDDEWVDFHGDHLSISSGELKPKPVSTPRPLLVNAGQSKAGIEFAAKHMDFTFQTHPEMDTLRGLVSLAKETARERYDRELSVLASGYVVCADTERDARDYLDYYVEERGDFVAARNMIDQMLSGDNQSLSKEFIAGMSRQLIAGWGGVPLVGTPEQIVDRLGELHRMGIEGIAMTWVDYEAGVEQFEEQVVPLMIDAGLRQPVGEAVGAQPDR